MCHTVFWRTIQTSQLPLLCDRFRFYALRSFVDYFCPFVHTSPIVLSEKDFRYYCCFGQ